jgi:hypothetical protein
MPDPLALYPALAGVSPGLPALGAAGQALAIPAGALLFSEREPEREGWVELSRERIRILDSAALRAHAQHAV